MATIVFAVSQSASEILQRLMGAWGGESRLLDVDGRQVQASGFAEFTPTSGRESVYVHARAVAYVRPETTL